MAEKYEVTSITPTAVTGPGGIVGPGYQVDFMTKPSGIPGIVRLPAAVFTPEAVHTAAHAEAGKLEAVKAL